MVRLPEPAEGGSNSLLRSANCGWMRCSIHICVTESSVNLNLGTHLTLVKLNLMICPSSARAITGMVPMHVARVSSPSAWPKISSHGLLLMRLSQCWVSVAVFPESTVARIVGRSEVDSAAFLAAAAHFLELETFSAR